MLTHHRDGATFNRQLKFVRKQFKKYAFETPSAADETELSHQINSGWSAT